MIKLRDCFRDGWALGRKYILLICVMSLIYLLASELTTWLLAAIQESVAGGLGSVFTALGGNTQGILDLMQGDMPKLTPEQSLFMMLPETLITLLFSAVSFFCALLISAKTLSALAESDDSLAAGLAWIRNRTGDLIKLWLLVELVLLLPGMIIRALGLLVIMGNSWLFAFVPFIVIFLFVLSVLSFLLVFIVISIGQFAYCYTLMDGFSGCIEKAFLLFRRNAGKTLLLSLFSVAVAVAIDLIFFPLVRIHFAFGYLTVFVSQLFAFFVTIAFCSLFFRANKPSAALPVDEGEDFAAETIAEIAAAETVADCVRVRAAASFPFDDVGQFHDGLAKVLKPGSFGVGKWGYADTGGSLVLPFEYKEASDFQDGIALVRQGKTEFFIDRRGQMAVGSEYDQADIFREGLAVVKTGTSWGVLNRDGDVTLTPYEDLYGFSEGLAAACYDQKWLFIDSTLKPALNLDYNEIWSFYCGRAMVEWNGKFGYIDKSGREIIPPVYDDAQDFSCGLAAVARLTGDALSWGYIDAGGKEIVPLEYEATQPFAENRAAIKRDGSWGHIDSFGTIITPPEYDFAGSFSEGFAVVHDERGFGYVGADGAERIAPGYIDARPFSEGLAWVRAADGWEILERE